MPDLLRREFLIKVLMTIGSSKLVAYTGIAAAEIFNMSIGAADISERSIEAVYQALAECA